MLLDQIGQVLTTLADTGKFTEEYWEGQLEGPELPPGMYYLYIQCGPQFFVKKLIHN